MLPPLPYRREDYDEYARRAEDKPTTFDGVLRFLAAAGQLVGSAVCVLGWWLFLRDMQTPTKPFAAAVFLTVAVGFVLQSIRNVHRGVKILRLPR